MKLNCPIVQSIDTDPDRWTSGSVPIRRISLAEEAEEAGRFLARYEYLYKITQLPSVNLTFRKCWTSFQNQHTPVRMSNVFQQADDLNSLRLVTRKFNCNHLPNFIEPSCAMNLSRQLKYRKEQSAMVLPPDLSSCDSVPRIVH
jgi:hypothetical protein